MTIFDVDIDALPGGSADLGQYRGNVVLVVNVASKCGLTPQYAGLEKLYATYRDRGLVVLGFPCNQFGGQEPGEAAEIEEFCQVNYGVTFPMFAKVDVNGDGAHPLFQWLRKAKGGLLGDRIKWNFTKFLVGPDGEVVERYASITKPEKLTADIEAVLPAR